MPDVDCLLWPTGAGKTTFARSLAHPLQATYLRIDTIEDTLRVADGMSFARGG